MDSDQIEIGTKYRYIVDSNGVTIVPDKNGNMTVSRKRVGERFKPLFDIRSKEVKALVSKADYLEIEVLKDKILVHTYRKSKIAIFRKKICTIDEVLGVKSGEIVLKRAAGDTSTCYQYTLSDWLSSVNSSMSQTEKSAVEKDLKAVYDTVSLFSGAGLFDKAWLDSGRFRFVFANDFDKNVLDTYRANIGNHIVCKDIRDVNANEIPFADVFLTSPCCQAFSNSNRHNINSEEAEEKRLLVEEVVRLVKEKKPKVFVIENVPGMLTKEDGLYLHKVLDNLSEYEFTVEVIEDHKVGGYSTRKRAIIIGSNIGRVVFPEMKMLTFRTVKDALDKVDPSWYNFGDVTIPSEETKKKMSYVPQGGNWQSIPAEIGGYGPKTHSNIMRRLKEDEPSITLSNFRKSNILHPTEDRILTVAEAGAIMGLDKDFRFISDSLSAMQQMVANGVTQAISKFVRNAVLRTLDANRLVEEV